MSRRCSTEATQPPDANDPRTAEHSAKGDFTSRPIVVVERGHPEMPPYVVVGGVFLLYAARMAGERTINAVIVQGCPCNTCAHRWRKIDS